MSIASIGLPPSTRAELSRSAPVMVEGTRPDNTMSNPASRIFQVIWSAAFCTSSAWKLLRAMPSGAALISAAAHPSPNSRKVSNRSRSAVSWKCNVQSSRQTTSTLAVGVERTMWCAILSAFIAAWHPMKPMTVRSTDEFSPHRSSSSRSTPGAEKPVQLATMRWVMLFRSLSPRPSLPTAAVPSAGAAIS